MNLIRLPVLPGILTEQLHQNCLKNSMEVIIMQEMNTMSEQPYINKIKGKLFNPDELHAIAKAVVGLERQVACAQIVAELKRKYPDHIHDDLP